MKKDQTPKILIISYNPITYHAQIFRRLHRALGPNLYIWFFTNRGLVSYFNEEMNAFVTGEASAVKGFDYFLPVGDRTWSNFFKGLSNSLRFFPTHVLVFGYVGFPNFLIILFFRALGKKIRIRGEGSIVGRRSSQSWIKAGYVKLVNFCLEGFFYSSDENLNYLKSIGFSKPATRYTSCCDDDFWMIPESCPPGRYGPSFGNSEIVRLIFVGRLTERKRPEYLIDVATKIHNYGKEVEIWYVGEGPLEADLRDKAAQRGLVVHVTGYRPRAFIRWILSNQFVGVLPSVYDPSPKILHEMINMHIPIFVSGTVGTSEEIVESTEGVFVLSFEPMNDAKKILLVANSDIVARYRDDRWHSDRAAYAVLEWLDVELGANSWK